MRGTAGALLVTAALLLAAAPAARADVYDDNPAAVGVAPGNLYVFARAGDGEILVRHRSNGAWSDWSSIGGIATSGPAAVAYSGGIDVFVRGTDGAISVNRLANGSWSGWSSLGGGTSSAPAAAVRRGPPNYLDLAVRGTDNAIWFQAYVPGAGWSGWASLGGNATSAPAVASQSDGAVTIFARGTDATAVERVWNGSAWSDWTSLGGGIVGAPAALSRVPNEMNVYVRGAANATYANVWTGAWSGWIALDGSAIDSTPVPFSEDADHEGVVARAGNNLEIKEWSSTVGWGAWTDTGPIAVPAPAPAPAPAPPPDGEVNLDTGLQCTPPGGKLRVSIAVHKAKGKAKPRVVRIVFFTKGKGRSVRVDRKAPFVVHMKINRPAGTTGRVYARVYYKRSKHGPVHRKTVSRRYVVCR